MSYKALDAITAIQTRPEMYIGTTETPNHLATEIVDNALDELANNFATTLNMHIEDGAFWVSDNGRGLKVYQMEVPDKGMMDSVEALFTILHSGSKFDLDDYNTIIGMHGVGLVTVNALSDWVVVKTRDRKKKTLLHVYIFREGKLFSKEQETNRDYSFSTVVGFQPSKKFFTSVEFNPRFFVERFVLVQAKYPNSTLVFNGNKIPKITFERFIRNQLQLNGENIFKLQNEGKLGKGMAKAIILTTVVENPDSLILGEVNLRLCEGTYLNSFQTELKKQIALKIDKKFKNVSPNQLLSGLRAFVSLTVPEPRFDSQTKVRMVLPVKKKLIDTMIDQISWFVSQEEIIKTIEKNLERKFFTKITKSSKRYRKQTSAENKIKDCLNIPGDVLYILEGDSALGTLKQIRHTSTEAIFPLKGKVLNVESNSLERISKNKEIQDLLEALGPKNNRRYKTIKIIADADVDGAHIVVLVLLLLQRYADDMIRTGNVSVILPPLHGAMKGKQFIPIYTANQMTKYKQEGYTIQRFKGLGEMNPSKLEPIIRSGFEYVVTWPENERVLQNIISVVTDTQIKRAIMNNEKCKFDNIIAHVIDQLKSKFNKET